MSSTLPRTVPINTISWPCTHNAFNSDAEIGAGAHEAGGTNQNHSIIAQLNAGVRAFMIDIHADGNGLRVRHVGGIMDADLNFEDLCDLLIKLKQWIINNSSEVIILMLEVDGNVDPKWIKETFEGNGPSTRTKDYNLSTLLYTHDKSKPWPSINDLVQQNKHIIVFRETDDGKGRLTSNAGTTVTMGWYHDMWEYWLETPYSNKGNYWSDLQTHTYVLSPTTRGNPATAAFFNLNHFVDTGTYAAGSAGAAAGINQNKYLKARALIAWKMQGARPTLSVDFFKSIPNQKPVYDTTQTVAELNNQLCITGEVKDQNNHFFNQEITWEGIKKLTFSEHLGGSYLDWDIDENLSFPKPRSRRGYYSFPSDGSAMTLTPSCPGFHFDPASVTWDGVTPNTQGNFTAKPLYRNLQSGSEHNLFCLNHKTFLYQSNGDYAYTNTANQQQHKLANTNGSGSIMSGDTIYIRATEPRILNHYLRSSSQPSNDVWYEDVKHPTNVHKWKIEKVDAHMKKALKGASIYIGDTVLLSSMDEKTYLCARGEVDYVSLTDSASAWVIK